MTLIIKDDNNKSSGGGTGTSPPSPFYATSNALAMAERKMKCMSHQYGRRSYTYSSLCCFQVGYSTLLLAQGRAVDHYPFVKFQPSNK